MRCVPYASLAPGDASWHNLCIDNWAELVGLSLPARTESEMSVRIIAASVASIATFFAGMAVALACSPALPKLNGVIPNDGATISPRATFSIQFTGAGGGNGTVTLRDGKGGTVEMKAKGSVSAGLFARYELYQPTEPLEEGATYTLDARLQRRSGAPESMGEQEVSASYTVESADEKSAPPKPEHLALYTIHRPGAANSCDPDEHETEVRFDYPDDGLSEVGYFTVTYREKRPGESGGGSETVAVGHGANEDGTFSSSSQLGFEPQCVAVDVYSPDRTAISSIGTCTREVCADARDPNVDAPLGVSWSNLPACSDDGGGNGADTPSGGGCGGCSHGNGGAPGSVPVLLVALLGLIGVRRIF